VAAKVLEMPALDVEQELDTLANMEPYAYEGVRAEYVKKLKFRPKVLDAEYARRRAILKPEEKQACASGGQAIVCENVAPWDDPVNGARLLDDMSYFVRRVVVFQRDQDADTFALWILGTYCIDAFDIYSYFGVTAPKEGCGKSTLLEILMEFANRVIGGSSMSGPVVYRMIQLFKPTIVLDEMDGINKENNAELLRVFNAGHKRSGAVVYRCAGDDSSTPEAFNCFGPKAFGMIDKPGRTLLSRSIMIDLQRKTKDQKVEKFNLRTLPAGTADMILRIKRQCTRWAVDHASELGIHIPDTADLENREADNWTPLISIAALAGRNWPDRVRDAAKLPAQYEKLSDRDLLLQDIANIFFARKDDRITTATLVSDLLLQHEGSGRWHRMHRDRASDIDANDVSELLGPFGIGPRHLWFNPAGTPKGQEVLPGTKGRIQRRGYALSDLKPLFDRYLEPSALEEADIGPEPF